MMRKNTKLFKPYHELKLVFMIAAACMLMEASGFFYAGTATAKPAVKATDSMRLERQTTEGVIIGTLDSASNTLSWKGIPYAKPPVGNLRWKATQKPVKRAKPLKAENFCEICPQYIDHDGKPATPMVIQGSEDCLYLNIMRPGTRAANLPVMVWIHGGGNSIQSPLVSKTDTSVLAVKYSMVVVTVNYRLGPMGFFSHPALRSGKKGDEKNDSGNYTTLDLIQALTWVKANIKNFGGNPNNVTVFGESAGGFNIINLISSPLAKGLFQRAISQSGGVRMTTPEAAALHAVKVISKLMIKDGTASDETAAGEKIQKMPLKELENYLRSKSAADFLETYPEGKTGGMIYFPTSFADGSVLPRDFYGSMKEGKFNRVPTILGTNKEEAKLFLRSHPQFAAWAADGSLYKDAAKTELYNLVARYQSDGWKVMGVDSLARIMNSTAKQPLVYAYQFLWGAGSPHKSLIAPPFNILLGSCHGMEIDFVFGTPATVLTRLSANDKNRPGRTALSNAMMDYWTQFARTGNPNRKDSGLPNWAPWSNSEKGAKSILLDAGPTDIKVEMSTDELTNEAIEKALQAEPRQKEIRPFWDNSLYRSKEK